MSHEPMPSGTHTGGAENPGTLNRAIYVPAGQDRFMEPRQESGGMLHTCKVSTRDTHGGLYIFENINMGKGGPPRHIHLEEDEWFYVVQGEFVFEVGDERFQLKPGDSLFAPRNVPHAFACVGDIPGRLLFVVQPAGGLEAFFRARTQSTQPLTWDEDAKLAEAHGIRHLGQPLAVD